MKLSKMVFRRFQKFFFLLSSVVVLIPNASVLFAVMSLQMLHKSCLQIQQQTCWNIRKSKEFHVDHANST
jgi:hypothetical protein